MTAKRFTHKEDDWEILNNGKHLAYAHSGYQADKICELLNELSEENKELKQRVNNKIKELEKERKSAIGGTWYSDKLIAQIEILEELKEVLEE